MLDEVNRALADAVARKDPHWTLRFTPRAVLDAMDKLLVRDQHPLAYQPGTQEHRFCTLAQNAHQFKFKEFDA
jgi:hypothetical protein